MHCSLKWTTWPAWVFYGWYWFPHTWPKLCGDESPATVRYMVEMVRQNMNGDFDE